MSTVQLYLDSYSLLLKKVRGVLLNGQKQISKVKIRVYWETGRMILRDILKNKKRAEYGAEVIAKLSKDLKLSKTLLNRCVRFAETYSKLPIGATSPQLTWSHFQELLKVSDESDRARLEADINTKSLSVSQLADLIKKNSKDSVQNLSASKVAKPGLLKPLRGQLYHYRIVRRPDVVDGQSDLRVDLGFRNFEKLSLKTGAEFKEDDIVTSTFKEGSYHFSKVSDPNERLLYTYEAKIERIIDGDTLKVRFDQGFDFERTETLRLRGIDCPEIDTAAGLAAKDFVQLQIKQAVSVVVRSSYDDKYGRYLADVFILSENNSDKEIFLNNLLLETGHAVRMY